MIKLLEVKNLFDYSYSMNLATTSELAGNTIRVKGTRLYSTFQIYKENRDIDFTNFFNAIGVLKNLRNKELKTFCTSFLNEEDTLIKLQYYIYYDNVEYKLHSYEVCLNNSGIISEKVDGTLLLKVSSDRYKANIPIHLSNYLEGLLYYDVGDSLHAKELKDIFFEALSLSTFRKFLLRILKLCGESPINIYRGDIKDILVKYDGGKLVDFYSESREFQHICLISWLLYIVLIKTGTVILHNLDKYLSTDTITKLVLLVGKAESLSFNNAQLIFSAEELICKLEPEQSISINKLDLGETSITYCSWQNF